ncbi:MAG: VirB4 family type IV secretion system protein [Candidatus Dormibacteria bacterium]
MAPVAGSPDAGATSCWHVAGPDLLELTAPDRQRLTTAFAGWLDQLEAELTFVVCSRRLRLQGNSPGAGNDARTALERARLAHLRAGLEHHPSYSRPVYLVVPKSSGDSVAELTAQLAQRCGLTVTRVEQLPALAEGVVRETVTSLRVGGRWLACLRLAQLPGVEVEPGWLWALLGMAAEYDLAIHIRPRSGAAADRHLRYRLRGLRARELAAGGQGSDPNLEAAVDAADRLRRVLATGSGRVFELAVTVSLAADSAPQAASVARGLRARMEALRGSLTPAWLDELPARLESVAANAPARRRLVDTAELATLWPWLEGGATPSPRQSLLGRHLRTGLPVAVDLHCDRDLANANLGVVASSGSGKSYLAGLVGLEAVRRGQLVVVVDPENEHRGWCEAVGGEYLDLADSPASGFNILEMGEAAETPLAALDLVRLLCGPLGPEESGCLLQAIGGLQRAAGQPVLGDCLPVLEAEPAGRSLAHRMRPWVQGTPGHLFSRPGRGPAVRSALGIGIRDLPPAWIPGATLLVSRWLWDWAKGEPGLKQVIVDEAGLLADNPALQSLMTHLARRIRKYHGSLMLLTQAAGDLVGGAGEVVAVNSATMLLGAQAPAGAFRLQRAFALDDAQRDWLQQAGRSHFLLVSGPRRCPLQVEAPGLHHLWLTGAWPGPDPAAELGPALGPG